MAEISFLNKPSITTSQGSNLMKALLDANIPVASSCGGDGVCGKCRIEVLQGQENLSLTSASEQMLIEKHGLGKNTRISCQCKVFGNIKVDAKYW